MKAYTVYRVAFILHEVEPVGMVMERRKSDRGNNIECLLKMAKNIYPTQSMDSHIYISPE